MLHAGSDTRALLTPDKGCRHFACKVRVFGDIFKVSATQRIPFDIAAGAQYHRNTSSRAFTPNSLTLCRIQLPIPCSTCGHRCWEASGRQRFIDTDHVCFCRLTPQAVGAIRHHDGGDPILGHCLGMPKVSAGTKRNLVLQGHCRDNLLNIHLAKPPTLLFFTIIIPYTTALRLAYL